MSISGYCNDYFQLLVCAPLCVRLQAIVSTIFLLPNLLQINLFEMCWAYQERLLFPSVLVTLTCSLLPPLQQ